MAKQIENSDKKLTRFEGSEQGYVTLPYSYEQFKEFITGLLGKQQNIKKDIRGQFEIDKDSIVNLHNKLSQRIFQQNEAELIEVSFSIVLDDDSTVTVNSLEEFITYNEVKPCVSLGCHITWIFLVKFRDKSVLEKQTINVSILTEYLHRYDQEQWGRLHHGTSGVSIRIEHTARTWGVDIESLLTNHFRSILILPKGFHAFLRKLDSDDFSNFYLVSFLILSSICSLLGFFRIENEFQNKISSIGPSELIKKVDFLIEISSSGLWTQYFFYVFMLLLFSLLISIPLATLTKKMRFRNKPSFLLLTNQTLKWKEEVLKNFSNGTLRFISSIGLAILTGVIANFIFLYLTNPK
jgi:hypothetical protein